MKVDVIDRLSRPGVAIEDKPKSVGQTPFPRDIGGLQVEMPDEGGVFRREVEDGRDMPFGNHQNMRRRLGIDVLDGDALLVLMNLGGGDRPFDDFAEEAILVHQRAPRVEFYQSSRELRAR